tara:strand:- start:9739 stop:10044 length:306 start_codon:yes stop_codon:yes gene_type:complete
MPENYEAKYIKINGQEILSIKSPLGRRYGFAGCPRHRTYSLLPVEELENMDKVMKLEIPEEVPIKESKLVANLIKDAEKAGPNISSDQITLAVKDILGDRD